MLFARGHLNLYLSPSLVTPLSIGILDRPSFFSLFSFTPTSGFLAPGRTKRSDTKKVLHGKIEDRFSACSTLFVIDSPYPILGGTFGGAYAYVRYLWSICKYPRIRGKSKRILKRCWVVAPSFFSSSFLSLDKSPLTLCSLRFIEIGRGGWLPSVKSRRKWGSANAARRQRRRIHDERYSRDWGTGKTKASSQTRTSMLGALSPRFRSWPESLACLRMHARRANAAFTCWEIATALFASRIRDDKTSENGNHSLSRVFCFRAILQTRNAKWRDFDPRRILIWMEIQAVAMHVQLSCFQSPTISRSDINFVWDAIFILYRNDIKAIHFY